MIICSAVLRNWASVDEAEQSKLLPLLRRSYQLYPEQFRLAADEVEGECNEANGREMQKLVDLISLVVTLFLYPRVL